MRQRRAACFTKPGATKKNVSPDGEGRMRAGTCMPSRTHWIYSLAPLPPWFVRAAPPAAKAAAVLYSSVTLACFVCRVFCIKGTIRKCDFAPSSACKSHDVYFQEKRVCSTGLGVLLRSRGQGIGFPPECAEARYGVAVVHACILRLC